MVLKVTLVKESFKSAHSLIHTLIHTLTHSHAHTQVDHWPKEKYLRT